MNRKVENEYKQLVKLGVPDETARLIAVSKYNPDSEESKALIEEEKELQNEIRRFISEFKKNRKWKRWRKAYIFKWYFWLIIYYNIIIYESSY